MNVSNPRTIDFVPFPIIILSAGSLSVQNHERRSRLLDLIRIRGFAALDELVRELGVSESTIRRDLDALEEQGSAKRTHGGVLYSGGMPRLAEFDERQPANWAAKRAIAATAAEVIGDGETVLLDGGTTTYEVARLLVGRSLQVVTNSLPVANLFASEARTDLVLLGGYVSPRTGVCLGPYANELLGRLHVTTTVLSAAGISEEGLFNAHLLLAETEQAMLEAAGRVIVVADSSKFGRKSLTLVSELSAIDVFVSDDGLPPAWRDTIAKAGAELLITSVPDEDATPPSRHLRRMRPA
ncbi:MAG: DeoR/GlpR transcriptional regulator [Planctomycetia bacterium]|nr:DeoR/GlpR transcriptional regulator [Planctomycetia bacterium]